MRSSFPAASWKDTIFCALNREFINHNQFYYCTTHSFLLSRTARFEYAYDFSLLGPAVLFILLILRFDC